MSNRETPIESSINNWKGVNQRIQPTLIQEGFLTNAIGCFFGLGENAERLPGKRLAGFLDEPIFNIFPFDKIVIVQTMENLYAIPMEDLLEFNITI